MGNGITKSPRDKKQSVHFIFSKFLKGVLNHDYPKLPELLKSMGMHHAGGQVISWQMAADFADVFQKFVHPGKHYCFGEDEGIYNEIRALGFKHMGESMDMVFPRDVIFIDRAFSGHFGNLNRLNACANWRMILLEHLSAAFPGEEIIRERY